MATRIEGLSKEKVLLRYITAKVGMYSDFEFNVWFVLVCIESKSKYIYKQQVSHLVNRLIVSILKYLHI